MSPEQQAIGALWVFIQAGILGAFKWLTNERAQDRVACNERIAKLEGKLDESADLIRRQNDSMQKQLDAQATLLAQQSQMIGALQRLSGEKSS
jgi:hypothetical protein